MDHLHAHQLEALHLKPLDDLTNDAPLHAIRLDGDECTFLQLSHDSETKQRMVESSRRPECCGKNGPGELLTVLRCI